MVFETWNKGQHLISEKCRKIWEYVWYTSEITIKKNTKIMKYENMSTSQLCGGGQCNISCSQKCCVNVVLIWLIPQPIISALLNRSTVFVFGEYIVKLPGHHVKRLSGNSALYSQVPLWAFSCCCWSQIGHPHVRRVPENWFLKII